MQFNENEIPGIILRFRENYSKYDDKTLVKLYFELLNKMRNDVLSKNFNSMMSNGQASLGLVEALIRDSKKSYGSFDIKSIPAIDWVLPHLAIHGNIGQLKNIKVIVDYFPELEKWKIEVDNAFIMQKLASKIYVILKEHPNTLQKDLKNYIDYSDNKLIANVVYYMLLQRKIKKNNS